MKKEGQCMDRSGWEEEERREGGSQSNIPDVSYLNEKWRVNPGHATTHNTVSHRVRCQTQSELRTNAQRQVHIPMSVYPAGNKAEDARRAHSERRRGEPASHLALGGCSCKLGRGVRATRCSGPATGNIRTLVHLDYAEWSVSELPVQIVCSAG